MKKFLSLMLAMIMVMSLVTVGAGAAFTDAEEIQQKEAVALLSGLGIIGGYADGSFKPGNSISRGAAAKIITWMTIGTAKVDAMTADGVDEVPFPDVRKDSSTAVFIEYCKEQDIIGGYSDGTFRPYADLTGYAFLKMALKALGVDDIDFSAKGWQIDAAAKAEDMGLLEGIDPDEVDLSVALSRENACQIAFNALGYAPKSEKAYVIVALEGASAALEDLAADETVYESRTEAMAEVAIVDKDAVYGDTFKIIEKATTSLAAKVFNLEKTTGIVKSNAAVESKVADAGKTVLDVDGTETTFKFASGLDVIGHNVTVYTDTKAETVVAVYDNSKTLAVTEDVTTVKAVKTALGKTTIALGAGFQEFDENYEVAETEITVANLFSGTTNTDTITKTGTLIIDGGKIIGFVNPTKEYLAKVTAITLDEKNDGKDATLSLSGSAKANNATTDAINEYEGIAKNHYVVYTLTGEIYNLKKAETVYGKITKIDGTKVTLDGKVFDVTGENTCSSSQLAQQRTLEQIDFAKEYTLYISGDKYLAITGEAPAKTVVYLVAVYDKDGEDINNGYGNQGTGDTTYWAQCVTTTGTEVQYQVTETQHGDLETSLAATPAKRLFEVTTAYNKADDATYATFTEAGKKTSNAIDEDELKIANNEYYTDTVKFISVTGEYEELEVVVKTGVQNVDEGSYKYYKLGTASSGNYPVSYVFVDGEFAGATAKATGDIVYAIESDASETKTSYVDEEGDIQTAYYHTVYIDGVKTEILVDNGSAVASAAALEGFIELTEIVEGVYSTRTYGETYDEVKLEVANLIKFATVSNVYKTKITVEGYDNATADAEEDCTLIDAEAGEAEIVDLRKALDKTFNEKELITELSSDLKNLDVALVLDDTTFEVVMIYIVG